MGVFIPDLSDQSLLEFGYALAAVLLCLPVLCMATFLRFVFKRDEERSEISLFAYMCDFRLDTIHGEVVLDKDLIELEDGTFQQNGFYEHKKKSFDDFWHALNEDGFLTSHPVYEKAFSQKNGNLKIEIYQAYIEAGR